MQKLRGNAKPLSEAMTQKMITKKLQQQGWLVVKIIQCTLNGFPDLMCLRNGITIFIEVKSSTGKPSPLQLYRHKQLTDNNFTTLILTDVQNIPQSMLHSS